MNVPLSVDQINRLPDAQAESAFLECCGSRAWAVRMVAARPFRDAAALVDAADRAWQGLSRADRLEAFRAHPRIGGRQTGDGRDRSASWSAGEQSHASGANDEVRQALSEANAEYERRFGHIFIVCATGKSAEEMLALLRARMANDPRVELDVAAEEQRRITRLRLLKLIDS